MVPYSLGDAGPAATNDPRVSTMPTANCTRGKSNRRTTQWSCEKTRRTVPAIKKAATTRSRKVMRGPPLSRTNCGEEDARTGETACQRAGARGP